MWQHKNTPNHWFHWTSTTLRFVPASEPGRYASGLTWYQYMVPFGNEAQASENARANLQTTH